MFTKLKQMPQPLYYQGFERLSSGNSELDHFLLDGHNWYNIAVHVYFS